MRPSIASREIRVCRVDLRDDGWDEHARRFFAADSADGSVPRSLESRRAGAALRRLLGACLGREPVRLRIGRGLHGKPDLGDASLSFNLSHSRGYALIAVSLEPVGVDLEFVDPGAAHDADLFDAVLHPAERSEWRRSHINEPRVALYRLWVRKEAYAKALGFGLSRPACRYRVIDDHSGVRYVLDDERPAGARMYLFDLDTPAGYTAALCTPIVDPRIQEFALAPRGEVRWT